MWKYFSPTFSKTTAIILHVRSPRFHNIASTRHVRVYDERFAKSLELSSSNLTLVNTGEIFDFWPIDLADKNDLYGVV